MRFKIRAVIDAEFDCTNEASAQSEFTETVGRALETDNFYNVSFTDFSAVVKPKKYVVTLRWEKSYTVEAESKSQAENEACNLADADDAEVQSVAQSGRTTLITEEKI
jgi:hypothetical protein